MAWIRSWQYILLFSRSAVCSVVGIMIPSTIDEICSRLDLIQERYERSLTLDDQRLWSSAYRNVLSLLREKASDRWMLLTYASYSFWGATHLDTEERE